MLIPRGITMGLEENNRRTIDERISDLRHRPADHLLKQLELGTSADWRDGSWSMFNKA